MILIKLVIYDVFEKKKIYECGYTIEGKVDDMKPHRFYANGIDFRLTVEEVEENEKI